MECFYLIDYENVLGEGLTGCSRCTETDRILVFFTSNASKIDMRCIADHGKAEISLLEIPSGKQSADMHIASYLGYLAGTCSGSNCCAVVVSKDKDFDRVIEYWNRKGAMRFSRVENIEKHRNPTAGKKRAVVAEKMVTAVSAPAAPVKPVPALPENTAAESAPASDNPDAAARQRLHNDLMKLVSAAGFESDAAAFVASTAVENQGKKNAKQLVYRAIISKYGQGKGLEIYNCIKKSLT